MITRRSLLLSTLAASALELDAARAFGASRTPVGGTLRLALPFAGSELDPHAANDPLSALFAHAVAEPLFALDAAGHPYPTLAAEPARATPGGAVVTLRSGLVTARGAALDARDVLFSLERAQKRGGVAVLAELPRPAKLEKAPLSVVFPGAGDAAVMRALASPLTALVPRNFKASAPDGTGAFRATLGARSWLFERNLRAARGPSFLERIELTLGGDLAACLRAFEAESADFGWLGAGLHRARARAVSFEGPTYGWVILRTGRDAKRWNVPGVAQGLLDALPREQFRHLGLVAPSGVVTSGASWGGGNADLLVLASAPQLVEMAAGLASTFSTQGQQVKAQPLTSSELAERRASGQFSLMLDFVAAAGPAGRATLLSLLAAVNPALVERPPNAPSFEPVDIARTLPLGVLGALRVLGARAPELGGLEAWQLGNAFRNEI